MLNVSKAIFTSFMAKKEDLDERNVTFVFRRVDVIQTVNQKTPNKESSYGKIAHNLIINNDQKMTIYSFILV